jgi:hypothetical protein
VRAPILRQAVDRAQAEAFQAPEGVWNSGADRVRLEVFALGALACFVPAGRPPAPDRASLRERLQRDGGLDLAADLPQVSSALRNLVREATRPSVGERLSDVTAFLDRLAQAERATAPPRTSPTRWRRWRATSGSRMIRAADSASADLGLASWRVGRLTCWLVDPYGPRAMPMEFLTDAQVVIWTLIV